MKQNKSTPTSAPSERRNLGFVKLRRGLREHLHRSRMSTNAPTLFVWLLLSAYHSGPRRGCVEANYEDVMRSLGWSYSMVRRSMRELALKGYIVVTPAANQHEITTIKIPKFDTWEGDSAVPTCEHTKTSHDSALFSGVLCAVSTSEQSGEQSRPLISKKAQDLQAPKNEVEVKKGKKGEADSVRRPINAELRIATRKSFSPSERRKKLEKRLTEAVRKNRSAHDDELFDDEREAFAYLGYEPRDSSGLPCGFVFWVANLYGKHKTEALSPGNLCSKIIDRLMAEQGSCKALGSDPSEYYWPPDFQDHRDRLRAKERARQQTVHVGNGVRA